MKKTSVKKLSIGLVVVLILIIAVIAGMIMFMPQNKTYRMDGPSMAPTISEGDQIKVSVLPADTVKRGDIIVFESPVGENRRLVKRVVGLPGDTVTIANGELLVTKPDGTTYKPYDDNKTPGNSTAAVKAKAFYVVGDNRENSLDSRIEAFGQVPFESLLGVAEKTRSY